MIQGQQAQGDVLFSPAAALSVGPKGKLTPVTPQNGVYVLAIGEATGHSHTAPARGTMLAIDEGGVTWMTVEELTEVQHQEHKILVLEPGTYRVDRQQEFDPFQGWRQVKD